MHSIKIKNLKRTLPENWNELKHDQILQIAPLIFNSLLEKYNARILVLMNLLSLKKKVFIQMTDLQIVQLIGLVEFLFDEEQPVPAINHFMHNGIKYIAPGEKLKNISIIEFAMADAYFEQIDYENANINAYNKIIAT
jgi:hypothetical protein